MNQDTSQTSLSNDLGSAKPGLASEGNAQNDTLHAAELKRLRVVCHKIAFFRVLEELAPSEHASAIAVSELCTLATDEFVSPNIADNRLYLVASGSVDVYREGRFCATLVAGESFGEDAYLLTGKHQVEYVSTPDLARPAELIVLPLNALFGKGKSLSSELSSQSKLLFMRMYVQRLAWRLERLRMNNPKQESLSGLKDLQGISVSCATLDFDTLVLRATELLAVTVLWQEQNAAAINS